MKKITLVILGLILIFSLAACGGNSKTPSGNNSTSTPPANNSTTPPASSGGDSTSTSPSSAPDDTTSTPVSGGKEWPNYDYLQDVPKPDFEVDKIVFEMYKLPISAYFYEVTIDEMKAFVEELKAAGFTVNEDIIDNPTVGIYSWSARNGEEDGTFTVTVNVTVDGTGDMMIGMPR